MTLPVEVVFRNVRFIDWVDADVRNRAARLYAYCRDIVSCRVLIEIPHRHHLRGKRFQMRIELSVPGEDIVVNHAPRHRAAERRREAPDLPKSGEIDATRKDVRLVVREAFDIARRELQDYVRRRRGSVKAHPRPGPRVKRAAERAGISR
jgi:hypothetical protein